MDRYIKLGYEGIEIELPVHALCLYRESEQLLSTITPLITEGNERKEKCIFVGKEKDCRLLKKKFKKQITTMSKAIGAADFVPWIKSEYDRLPKNYQGLRVFLESKEEFLNYEDILDDFNTQPDLKLFLLCQYQIKDISSGQLLDILKIHPYVFVEHQIKPNCFYSRMKHRIWLDPLTGIFNKRYFETQLTKELQRASRYEHTLSILILDIDQFKKINDEFGHEVGDHVLEELSAIVKGNVRSVDVVARYGGDEFVVLLPETKKAYALKTAERILEHVSNYDFFKDKLKVRELRITIGIAGFPEDAGGAFELIKKADNALSQAKRDGGGKALLCK